jgi:hypothetical protein
MIRSRHWASKKNPASFLLLVAFVLATAPALAKSEWVFDTLHMGSGSYRYYVTDDAIRLENTGNGGTSVAAAPTWKVSCFRPSEKLEFITDLKSFDHAAIFALIPKRAPQVVTITPKLAQAVTLKGLSCNKYELPGGAIYWTPKELKAAPEVAEVVARYFGTAAIGGIPIRVLKGEVKLTPAEKKLNAERRKKSAVPWLNFKQLEITSDERLSVDFTGWKKIPYKASDFEYPKGYKRTKDLKDVIISSSFRNEILDLAKGFTSDIDEKDKKKKSGAK